jgi:hypothetical protein
MRVDQVTFHTIEAAKTISIIDKMTEACNEQLQPSEDDRPASEPADQNHLPIIDSTTRPSSTNPDIPHSVLVAIPEGLDQASPEGLEAATEGPEAAPKAIEAVPEALEAVPEVVEAAPETLEALAMAELLVNTQFCCKIIN